MRVLITGARGFVGPHVAEALRSVCGDALDVVATSKEGGQHPVFGQVEALDVTDKVAVQDSIARHLPTHVVNLAGFAAPSAADADPQNTWRVHLQGTLNVASAILDNAPECCLIHVGSGLVYGESARSGLPLDENTLLAPIDDYGVTKAAADLALGALSRRGLKCIRLRPFNHTGPGQTEAFVVPAFAMQIARIEAGLAQPVIRVGNLEAERDFLDVRDVVEAYALVARKCETIAVGTILNVASGRAHHVGDLLQELLSLSRVQIKVEEDPARMRSSDLPRIVGNAEKARQMLGWSPKYGIGQILTDVLNDCRARVARA